MIPARTTGLFISFAFLVSVLPCIANDQTDAIETGKKTVRVCGLDLRTEFGHPARMKELQSQALKAFDEFLVSGNCSKAIDETDAYLKKVETEFGNAKQRDPFAVELLDELRRIAEDETRSTSYRDAWRHISFAEKLMLKALYRSAADETRKVRSLLLEAVPADSLISIRAENSLANLLAEHGEIAEADALTQSALSKARRKYGESHRILGDTLLVSGRVQRLVGNSTLSEQLLREASSNLAKAPEIEPKSYYLNYALLADALLAQSKFHETVELMEYLMPQLERLLNPRVDINCFKAAATYAKSLLKLERFDEAEAVLEKYHAVADSLATPSQIHLCVLNIYAAILEATDRAEKAEPIRRRIAKIDPMIRGVLPPGELITYDELMK